LNLYSLKQFLSEKNNAMKNEKLEFEVDNELLGLANSLVKKTASPNIEIPEGQDGVSGGFLDDPEEITEEGAKELIATVLERIDEEGKAGQRAELTLGLIRNKLAFSPEAAALLDESYLAEYTLKEIKPVPEDAIQTLDAFVKQLRTAAQLELTTIPLYLYGMYSIKEEAMGKLIPGSKQKGLTFFNAIRSVAIEEMLHLALVCNLISSTIPKAFGSYCFANNPKGDDSLFPTFPCDMPNRKDRLTLNLAPATKTQISKVYMGIELPEEKNRGAIEGFSRDTDGNLIFNTIGQFYKAIRHAYTKFNDHLTIPILDDGKIVQQYPGTSHYEKEHYFTVKGNDKDAGGIIPVKELKDAHEAIDTIIEQGEGATKEEEHVRHTKELAHFFKFRDMAKGDSTKGILYDFETNPKTENYPEKVQALSNLFNAAWRSCLRLLDEIIRNGKGDTKEPSNFNLLFNDMNLMMTPVAMLLRKQPGRTLKDANGEVIKTYDASPTFQYVKLASISLIEYAAEAIKAYQGDAEVLRVLYRVRDVIERSEAEDEDEKTDHTLPENNTWTKDILPMINGRDIQEMINHHQDWDLSKYATWTPKKKAQKILAWLVEDDSGRGTSGPKGSRMPDGGPYFTKREIAIVKKWIDDKMPK
jgi:hypothetical protein